MEVTHVSIITTTNDDGTGAGFMVATLIEEGEASSRMLELSQEQLNALADVLFPDDVPMVAAAPTPEERHTFSTPPLGSDKP